MKICTGCNKEQELDCFPKAGKTSSGKQRYRAECNGCKASRDRLIFSSNKVKKLAQAKAWAAIRLAETRKVVYDYLKSHPCVDCGNTNIVVLEFDHVNGEKTQNISTMVAKHMPIAKILQEIEKCEVRCANCHRIKTAERAGWSVLSHI